MCEKRDTITIDFKLKNVTTSVKTTSIENDSVDYAFIESIVNEMIAKKEKVKHYVKYAKDIGIINDV